MKRKYGTLLFSFIIVFSLLLNISVSPQISTVEANPGMDWLSPMSFYDCSHSDSLQYDMYSLMDESFVTLVYWGYAEYHWFIYDWGCSRDIEEFRWYADADERSRITSCDIYISDDPSDWGVAVAENVALDQIGWNEEDVTDKSGRFIKVEDIYTYHGDNYLLGYQIDAYCELTRIPDTLEWRSPTTVIDECGEKAPNYLAENYIDEDYTTPTMWGHDVDHLPHWIVMDLNATYNILSWSHYMWSSNNEYKWGEINVYASDEPSPVDWGAAINVVSDLTYVALSLEDMNCSITLGIQGRYVKVETNVQYTGTHFLRGTDCWFLTSLASSVSSVDCIIENDYNVTKSNGGGIEYWIFAEDNPYYYRFHATFIGTTSWEELVETRIRWTDGFSWVEASYIPELDEFYLLQYQDPTEDPIVRLSDGDVYNSTNLILDVVFEFWLHTNIMDALDVDIELWCIDDNGISSGWNVIGSPFNIYSAGGLIEYGDISGDGAKILKGDVFELEVDDATGGIAANYTWRNLQHIKMRPKIVLPTDRIDSAYAGEWTATYRIYYAVNNVWVNGWECKIEFSNGFTSPKDFWVSVHIRWYQKTVMIGTSEYFYSFWNMEPDQGTTLFVDLWFNSGNYSSIGGGRVECEYFGMQDAAPWWAFWYSDWGPMLSNVTSSDYYMDLLDDDDEICYTKQIKLIKVYCKLEKTATTGPYVVQLTDYHIFDKVFAPAQAPFTGIDTPDLIPPKVMDMPQNGMFGWLFQGLKNLLKRLTPPILSFWGMFVSFVDTIFSSIFQWENGFSTILGWINTFFAWMLTAVTYMIALVTNVWILFSALLMTIIDVFVMFITQWVNMIDLFTSLIEGGYGVGANLVEDLNLWGWMPLIGILYMVWLFLLLVNDGLMAVADHFTFVYNSITFVFSTLLGVANFVISLIFNLIEGVPVAE